jgi:hypothetical protein
LLVRSVPRLVPSASASDMSVVATGWLSLVVAAPSGMVRGESLPRVLSLAAEHAGVGGAVVVVHRCLLVVVCCGGCFHWCWVLGRLCGWADQVTGAR